MGIFEGIGNIITGSNSSPDFPEPTQEERNLTAAQTEAINTQRALLIDQLRQQNLVAPYIYQQAGLQPIYGDGIDPLTGQPGQVIVGFNQVDTPELIAQREALTNQAELSKLQLGDARLAAFLEPVALEQAGYTLQKDDKGNITGLVLNPEGPAALQNDVNTQLLKRTQQALAGTLPVDPNLQRQFDTSEAVLRSQLAKNLGPGYETSTPGIQALADFTKRKNETIYSAQHGEISFADQLAQAGQATNANNLRTAQGAGTALNVALSYQNPFARPGQSASTAQLLQGVTQAPFQGATQFGTLSQLYNNPLTFGQQERQLTYGALSTADERDQNHIFWRNLGQSAGQTLGKGAGGGFVGG